MEKRELSILVVNEPPKTKEIFEKYNLIILTGSGFPWFWKSKITHIFVNSHFIFLDIKSFFIIKKWEFETFFYLKLKIDEKTFREILAKNFTIIKDDS